MIIFIRNIPSETIKADIASFINSSGVQIVIEDIVIFSIQDAATCIFDHHGLVWVSPEKAGARIIKRLNGALLKETSVTVREYVIRSADNDPRKNHPDRDISFKERRISDRRRTSLIIPWQR